MDGENHVSHSALHQSLSSGCCITSCGPVKHSTYQGMLAPVGPEVIGNKMSTPVPVKNVGALCRFPINVLKLSIN